MAMLGNVVVPHVVVSIATREYMPGLGTGVLSTSGFVLSSVGGSP